MIAGMMPSVMALLRRANTWLADQTFSGRVFFSDGSAPVPSISPISAPTSGFYYSSGAIRAAIAGVERLLIAPYLRVGGATIASGYGNTGDIICQPTSGVRAKNTAKAWVNFNGSGTVAIRDSFNVSSITDNGVGNWTVNFANALADTNYSVNVSTRYVGLTVNQALAGKFAIPASTGSVQVFGCAYDGTLVDSDCVCVEVFGL